MLLLRPLINPVSLYHNPLHNYLLKVELFNCLLSYRTFLLNHLIPSSKMSSNQLSIFYSFIFDRLLIFIWYFHSIAILSFLMLKNLILIYSLLIVDEEAYVGRISLYMFPKVTYPWLTFIGYKQIIIVFNTISKGNCYSIGVWSIFPKLLTPKG